MRALRPTTFRGFGLNMLTCRGKLDAIGGSVGALPERDVFSGGYVRLMQLLVGVCGPVTIPAGKIPYRIGQDLTVASVGEPRVVAADSGICRARDRGFTPFRSQPFSLRVSSDARGNEKDAHTGEPV